MTLVILSEEELKYQPNPYVGLLLDFLPDAGEARVYGRKRAMLDMEDPFKEFLRKWNDYFAAGRGNGNPNAFSEERSGSLGPFQPVSFSPFL